MVIARSCIDTILPRRARYLTLYALRVTLYALAMPSMDMPLEQLRQYNPPLYSEEDFEKFWDTTLAESQSQPLNAELIPYNLPAKGLQCYAVRYDGFGGGRIAGWYVRPDAAGKFPGLCVYHGYSGRSPRPLELVPYAA